MRAFAIVHPDLAADVDAMLNSFNTSAKTAIDHRRAVLWQDDLLKEAIRE